MKRSMELMALATVVLMFGFAATLSAQGTLIIPKSSQPQPAPRGASFAAQSNILIYIPDGFKASEEPPYMGWGYETPASLGCLYGLTTTTGSSYAGCSPNNTSLVDPTGGSNTIAIVDPYDDPSALSDLAWFSLQFGLPLESEQFQVVQATTASSSCYPYGVPTDPYGEWEVEEATDIEWSHAMAPNAQLYLVEACSNSGNDLQQAVLVANNLVSCGKTGINATTGALSTTVCGKTHNPGEVSMSWGTGEFPGQTGTKCPATFTPSTLYPFTDACFTTTNIVYFAAAGDSPGVEWPSTSPDVVSAGGLTNRRNPYSTPIAYNLFGSAPYSASPYGETAWVFTGSGQSAYETQPSYQKAKVAGPSVANVCGTSWRCIPDLSFDADPYSPVWVYDTYPLYFGEYIYTWWLIGGTSVSAPSLAGIINNANTLDKKFAASTNAELTTIYGDMSKSSTYAADFTDITYAFCGPYMGFTAGTGWDFCSGVGAVNGYAGK
jgi:subtilase family serine protease